MPSSKISDYQKDDLRWRAPVLPPNVTGIQLADSEPPQCYQAPFGANPSNPFPPSEDRMVKREPSGDNEDCLFLKCTYLYPICQLQMN